MRKAIVSPGAVVKADTDLKSLAKSIGRFVDGNKSAAGASSGEFVVLLNSTISGRTDGLYTAAKAIPANTTIDSSYLTASSTGGLNALNANINAVDGKLTAPSLTECASLDALKTYLSGVIATMNNRGSKVIGVITRFADGNFTLNDYYEGHIYYISNANNGYFAGVLYSITDADYVNFSFKNGAWAFKSYAPNAKTTDLNEATNISGNLSNVDARYLKIGRLVVAHLRFTVSTAVDGNTTLFVLPNPLNSEQAVIPMANANTGIGDGNVIYIRNNGECRAFGGLQAGMSINATGSYICAI